MVFEGRTGLRAGNWRRERARHQVPHCLIDEDVTAMASLVLVEQGHIGLHERPAAYVPELAVLDPDITLHHLLSHTAGLRDVYDVPVSNSK